MFSKCKWINLDFLWDYIVFTKIEIGLHNQIRISCLNSNVTQIFINGNYSEVCLMSGASKWLIRFFVFVFKPGGRTRIYKCFKGVIAKSPHWGLEVHKPREQRPRVPGAHSVPGTGCLLSKDNGKEAPCVGWREGAPTQAPF